MNNELFDRMIKENLQEMQVAPSAGMKKVLGWKLFFQNLIVFHKVKVIAGLLFVTSGSTFYFVSNSSEVGWNDQVTAMLKSSTDDQNILVVEQIENVEDHSSKDSDIQNVAENKTDDNIVNNEVYTNVNQNSSDKKNEKVGTEKWNNPNLSNTNAKNSVKSNTSKVQVVQSNENNLVSKSEDLATTSLENEEFVSLYHEDHRSISLLSESNLTTPQEGGEMGTLPSIVEKGVYRELSFDLYKGLVGQSELESHLSNSIHRQYYWDFHGEKDVLNMNVIGGANVNYTFGSGIFRIKASTGVSYYQLNDQRANYEFNEITDEDWLEFFNTDELSWVNTFGKDTCMQCFYAHKTDELLEQMEQEYNQYSYLRVPLQIGTQLNFRYVSVDLLGGVDMNILTHSKGLYVQEGLNPNYERFYYWDDLQLSTLSKGNEMLKKSFTSWTFGANFRVRITKNFDLLAGYQINKSMGSITKDSYLMDKSLKSSNATVGLTFYPGRKALKGGDF
ncbi:MAG: hypothetical protein H6599_00665 [Flavobacteriales bacterium]|nr:hypothetical protein [Flavobacteriales bacterium]